MLPLSFPQRVGTSSSSQNDTPPIHVDRRNLMVRSFQRPSPDELRTLLPHPHQRGAPPTSLSIAEQESNKYHLPLPYRVDSAPLAAMSPSTSERSSSKSTSTTSKASSKKAQKQPANTSIDSSPAIPSQVSLPEVSHGASAITTMVSQYAILERLSHSLSSADLAHLAATNQEHRQYITQSKALHEKFRAACICDGKGIRSRAIYFGHWNAQVADATTSCQETEVKPCCTCEAMVCDACRFHLCYPDLQENQAEDTDNNDFENLRDLGYDFTTDIFRNEDDWAELADHMRFLLSSPRPPGVPIETWKALEVISERRKRYLCSACGSGKEAARATHNRAEWNANMGHWSEGCHGTGGSSWCGCNLDNLFLERRDWLCIPCFINMELEGLENTSRRYVKVFGPRKDLGEGVTTREVVSTTIDLLCDCGRPADPNEVIQCRCCNDYIRPNSFVADEASVYDVDSGEYYAADE